MIPLCKALGGEGCWPFCKGAGCEHPSCYYKLVTQVLLGNFNGDVSKICCNGGMRLLQTNLCGESF